jgi:hypothetical protein
MLIHNLADAVRAFRQAKRDIGREQAILHRGCRGNESKCSPDWPDSPGSP